MKKLITVIIAIVMLVSTLSVTAFAAENEHSITGSDRVNMIMHLDGQRAYCVERNEIMPDAGLVYTSTSFSRPERLDRVFVAISQLHDGSNAFEIASQYAVWQCYEGMSMVVYSNAIDGAEVSGYVEQILNAADMIDMSEWSVYVAFYGCEGYQTVATYGVNYIAPVVIPEEDDDKPEVTEPVVEPETEEPETEEPETEEPETEEPETEEPETEDPEVTEPETEDPEVTEPETEEPETEDPVVTEPETEEPETEDPVVTEPETEEPETEEPVVTEPETEEPETEEPTVPTNPEPVIPPQEVLGGEPTAPQTGDNSNIILWAALMAISALGVVFAIKAKRN